MGALVPVAVHEGLHYTNTGEKSVNPPPVMEADHQDNDNGEETMEERFAKQVIAERDFQDAQLGVLRDEATEVSRDKTRTRRMQLLDLPIDILRDIFDYFPGTDETGPTTGVWSVWGFDDYLNEEGTDHLQTIQSARLVCRLFQELASPLLCPVLRVRLGQASLDHVDGLSKNPAIAAGVRGIQIVLDYYLAELATDLSRFKDRRKEDLNRIHRMSDYYEELWLLGGDEEDDETVCPRSIESYRKAIALCNHIPRAWDDAANLAVGDSNDTDSVKYTYQKILHQSHKEYQRKHEEQLQLIKDGSFVDTLASSISRMANCTALKFIDTTEEGILSYMDDPTILLNETALVKFMTAPEAWKKIEKIEGAELLPAKILSELPIAAHKAGVKLRALYLSCLPLRSNFSMLCPDRPDELNPWADLHAACQSLQTFAMGCDGNMKYQPSRDTHHLPEDQAYINHYFGALLSSQSLEFVNIDLWCFTTTNSEVVQPLYRAGSILNAASSPCIKRVYIRHISLSQCELEKFCRQLGPSVEDVYLHDVELLSGSWIGVLDILREKVLSSCYTGEIHVYFNELKGGEFASGKKHDALALSSDPSLEWDFEVPSIIARAQKYVLGELTENPLKGLDSSAR